MFKVGELILDARGRWRRCVQGGEVWGSRCTWGSRLTFQSGEVWGSRFKVGGSFILDVRGCWRCV